MMIGKILHISSPTLSFFPLFPVSTRKLLQNMSWLEWFGSFTRVIISQVCSKIALVPNATYILPGKTSRTFMQKNNTNFPWCILYFQERIWENTFPSIKEKVAMRPAVSFNNYTVNQEESHIYFPFSFLSRQLNTALERYTVETGNWDKLRENWSAKWTRVQSYQEMKDKIKKT